MEQIGIGIIAGLLTTLLVVVVRQLWVTVIEPWYENRVYKDVRIEGVWHGKYGEGEFGEEVVRISRVGHNVTGSITVTNGPDKGQSYVFSGTFSNLILTAAYTAKDTSNLDRGSYCLMLVNNGSNLVGYSSFYEDSKHKIVSGKCTWSRKNS
jgi:hypothetical protein